MMNRHLLNGQIRKAIGRKNSIYEGTAVGEYLEKDVCVITVYVSILPSEGIHGKYQIKQ